MRIHLEEGASPPPPPSDALRVHVLRGSPVAPRRPTHDAVTWTAAAAVLAAACIATFGVRQDLVESDVRWLVLGLAFALVSVGGAIAATLPRPGQVLPSITRARWNAGGSVALLALATAFLAHDGPGSIHHEGAAVAHGIVHCSSFALVMVAPLVGLAWALVIRRVPVSAPLVGAALGAAAGALSGAVLNTVCPIAGQVHAQGGHVGAVVLGALLGAASSLFNRR